MLKGWIDRVLVCGTGYGGKCLCNQGGLRGKHTLVALTPGGREHMFGSNAIHGAMNDMLRPLLRATLADGDKDVLPPFIGWHAPYITAQARVQFLVSCDRRLKSLSYDLPLKFPTLSEFDEQLYPLEPVPA